MPRRGSRFPHHRQRRSGPRNFVKFASHNTRNEQAHSRTGVLSVRRASYSEVKRRTGATDKQVASDTPIKIAMPSPGTSASTRIGGQIKILELAFNYIILPNALQGSDAMVGYRFTIFQWWPDDTVQPPLAADLYSASATILQDALAFISVARRPLFKVIYDVAGTLSGSSDQPIAGANSTGVQKLRLRVPRSVVNFNTTSADGPGQLYFLFRQADLTDNAVTANTIPYMNYMTQVSFIDG